jgi:hypothetical protein
MLSDALYERRLRDAKTRKSWETRARTVACPTCNARPGRPCLVTWTNDEKPRHSDMSHTKRMEALLAGDRLWFMRVVGAE